VVKYTLGEQQERNIFTTRYQLHLPTVEELEDELRRELRFLSPGTGKASLKRDSKLASKAGTIARKARSANPGAAE